MDPFTFIVYGAREDLNYWNFLSVTFGDRFDDNWLRVCMYVCRSTHRLKVSFHYKPVLHVFVYALHATQHHIMAVCVFMLK